VDLYFSGINEDEDGIGAARRPGGGINRTGLTKLQQKAKDVIWTSIWSKVTLAATASLRTPLFTGTPSVLTAGNVANGQLPQPQAMAAHYIWAACNGIAGAGALVAELAKLLDGTVEVLVANKLMFAAPLNVIGLNAILKGATDTASSQSSGPQKFFKLAVPIVIPANTQFEVYFTSGPDAMTASNVLTIGFTGELSRLVM
jgi:hypothetical protein